MQSKCKNNLIQIRFQGYLVTKTVALLATYSTMLIAIVLKQKMLNISKLTDYNPALAAWRLQ